LRRADGQGAQAGGAGGKLVFRKAVTGVGRDHRDVQGARQGLPLRSEKLARSG
jgi:hypothetical protein